MAQAIHSKLIEIDAFIDDYLPEDYILSKDIAGKIKISDLGSHPSGLPDLDIQKLIALNPKQPLDIDEETIHALKYNLT
ncbi:hypothetical protein [Formosa sp. PL04]|uniref:hypothetical protein n=1 Tax=Formosa sp. PL04 TaxID=3081755 RepID=UPI0029821045|nr:hypothetical protein [Formosa sp. PL04]MDW5289783.1 hypothetical protein [Formosa sp. PL04]